MNDEDNWLLSIDTAADYEDKSNSHLSIHSVLAECGSILSDVTDCSSNDELDDGDVPKFDKLYDMSIYDTECLSKTPLFTGSSTSIMDALVAYLRWFSEHPGISKEALSEMLRVQHNEILPLENKLPSSYNEAMKLVEPFLIKPVVYHACPKDCILFREEFENLNACPKCGTSRYIELKIPAKRFAYLPVGPRLVRLFGTPNLAQIVQAHGLHADNSTKIYDVQSSLSWKLAYCTSGEFNDDYRGISFALNTDGVNPYSQNKVNYSMWPIILTVLNLPRKVRHLFANVWLVGTIPGNGSKEPNNHILMCWLMNY